MINNPNLYPDFVPLQPKLVMQANETCWCRSGKKWKKCHRDKQFKRPVTEGELFKILNDERRKGVCLHASAPIECVGPAIGSHTIQKAISLQTIEERGHVYSQRDNRKFKGHAPTPELVGVRKASTFVGFCSYHDGNTFRKIDKLRDVNAIEAFLLSYRSLCFEIYMKKVAVEVFKRNIELLDDGMEFEQQTAIQNSMRRGIYEFQIGFVEHSRRKRQWDKVLLTGDLSNFNYKVFELPDDFPMFGSGTFFPECDFAGKYLQPEGRFLHTYDLLAFNICKTETGLVLVFGWNKPEILSGEFVESLNAIEPNRFREAVLRFSFDITDNLFMRPSWWDGLTKPDRYKLSVFSNSTIAGARHPLALVPDGTLNLA